MNIVKLLINSQNIRAVESFLSMQCIIILLDSCSGGLGYKWIQTLTALMEDTLTCSF